MNDDWTGRWDSLGSYEGRIHYLEAFFPGLLEEIQKRALDPVRSYVAGNLEVWTVDEPDPMNDADLLAVAYADIYEKVLNVIDTGHPLREKA